MALVSDHTALLAASLALRFFLLYAYAGALGEHILWVLVPTAAEHAQRVGRTAVGRSIAASVAAAVHEDNAKLLANPILTGFPLYSAGAFVVIGVAAALRRASPRRFTPVAATNWREFTFVGAVTSAIVYYVLSAVVLAAVEYAAGVYVGAGAESHDSHGNVISWDYSDRFGNIDGKTDVAHALMFGAAGVLLLFVDPLFHRACVGATLGVTRWPYIKHLVKVNNRLDEYKAEIKEHLR